MSLNWEDTSPNNTERLTRAFGYPYVIPDHSYIVHNDAVSPIQSEQAASLREHRIPVLAVGSNQSPVQIMRKFRGPDWHPIPCERCLIHDFDTVFSAHISRYGSIAATLHPAPGTSVSLYINWLHESHMERMHMTELGNENYAFAELTNIRIETEFGLKMDRVHFYRGNVGAFMPDGIPVPLAEIPAQNRKWAALDQKGIQERLQAMTAPTLELDTFVLSSISEPSERTHRANMMRECAEPFAYSEIRIIKS